MSNPVVPPIQRLIALSCPSPVCSSREVLDVCHGYPDRRTQSCLGGKVLCVGEQFVLLLEGPRAAVEGLFKRIQRQVPEAGMTARFRDQATNRAFTGWAIEDLYLDEVRRRDESAADQVANLLIDLLAPAERAAEPTDNDAADQAAEAPSDPFAEAVAVLERYASTDFPRPVAAA